MVNVGIPNKDFLFRNPMIILIQPAVIDIYNFISVVNYPIFEYIKQLLVALLCTLGWRPIKIDYVESLSPV